MPSNKIKQKNKNSQIFFSFIYVMLSTALRTNYFYQKSVGGMGGGEGRGGKGQSQSCYVVYKLDGERAECWQNYLS